MKILFVSMVSFENNTSATIQNKGIVRGLVSLGHEVDVLTLEPNKNSISYDSSINDIKDIIKNSYYIDIDPKYARLMARKQKPMVETKNEKKDLITCILKKIRPLLKKVYDNLSIYDAQKYNVKWVDKLKINYNKYDLIISASDPKSSHLIVERILNKNKNCKVKWIQYWGDPMLIDITRKRDWRDILIKYEEGRLISKADRIIYASPLTLVKQKEIFKKYAHKMDYANQPYVNIPKANINKLTDQTIDSNVTVGYFGAYNSKIRNIIPLYNAAKNDNFNLIICGASDLKLENTEKISVFGTVPYNKVLEMEKQSDILVCICNTRGTQIPGKIYYCSSYDKPIIIILDGEYKAQLKDYFEQFNRFILCNNDEEEIKKAVKKARSELNNINYSGISEKLTPEYMATKIINGIF